MKCNVQRHRFGRKWLLLAFSNDLLLPVNMDCCLTSSKGGQGFPLQLVPVGHFLRIILAVVGVYPTACFGRTGRNLLQPCTGRLIYAASSISVALSRMYAFYPDVSPMLDNACDIMKVVVET